VPEPSAEDDPQRQALATTDGTAAGDTANADAVVVAVDGPLAEYQRQVREIDEQLLLAAPDRCVHTHTHTHTRTHTPPRASTHSARGNTNGVIPIYSPAFFCGLY